jgi:drug/metabolite transporter (DMT)-like permease
VIDAQSAAGIGAAAVAAVCFNAAVVLYAIESRSVPPEYGLRLSLVRQLARRRRWLAAVALDALGWPFQLLALSLAPLTVVQPTLAVGLLLLLAVGRRGLGEPVSRVEWAAVVAVVVGVAGLAAFAPKHTVSHPSPTALAAVLGVLLLVTAAPYLLPRRRVGAGTMILAAGSAFSATAITSKLVTDRLADGQWQGALAWAVGTAVVAAAGLLSETSALQRFEATRVSPAVFVLQTVAPVIAAPILIGEKWSATPGGGTALAAALVVTCSGGLVLARARAVVAVQHDADQAGTGTSSSTKSAAEGSSASDRSGARGDRSADTSAAPTSAGDDATSAKPKSR